jgi:AraC family transcriptional regulator
MRPIEKAIWFVESHFAGGISLGDIAATAGVSRFALARMFSERSERRRCVICGLGA